MEKKNKGLIWLSTIDYPFLGALTCLISIANWRTKIYSSLKIDVDQIHVTFLQSYNKVTQVLLYEILAPIQILLQNVPNRNELLDNQHHFLI